jgi:hypothetical protein
MVLKAEELMQQFSPRPATGTDNKLEELTPAPALV